MTPQEKQILEHLKQRPITPLEALNKYGVFRLSARIMNLRRLGYPIETKLITRGEKRFAEYSLTQSHGI